MNISNLNIDINTVVFGNTIIDYGYALIALIFFVIVFKIFQFYVLRRLKKLAEKTKTDIDDTLIEIIKNIKPPFYYFLAFYLATYYILVSDMFKNVIEGILLILVVYQIINTAQVLLNYVLSKSIDESDGLDAEELQKKAIMNNIGMLVKFALWSIGLLMILSNLGVNVTSLIAGLGIGGIAFAFALKGILADLFSSFAIYFDKPFKVGDTIQVGTDKGTVQKIGIMTTRMKTPQGEELVMSNQELISSRIQNFKKMEERRGVFSFGVVYETPVAQLRQIPADVEKIINSIDGIRFDRTHFNRFDPSSLNYEVAYYIETDDYKKYMEVQQDINLKIMEVFEEKGIEMAYPTQTVFVKNSS